MRHRILTLVLCGSVFGFVMGCDMVQPKGGVRVGATVEEVEKELGEPEAVLPNFGREQRIYKAKSGNKYMITFEDGVVVEIHR